MLVRRGKSVYFRRYHNAVCFRRDGQHVLRGRRRRGQQRWAACCHGTSAGSCCSCIPSGHQWRCGRRSCSSRLTTAKAVKDARDHLPSAHASVQRCNWYQARAPFCKVPAEWNGDEPKRANYKAWVTLFMDARVFRLDRRRCLKCAVHPFWTSLWNGRGTPVPDQMPSQGHRGLLLAPAVPANLEVRGVPDHNPARATNCSSRGHQISASRREDQFPGLSIHINSK